MCYLMFPGTIQIQMLKHKHLKFYVLECLSGTTEKSLGDCKLKF